MAAEVRAGKRFLGSKVCDLEVREELKEQQAREAVSRRKQTGAWVV